jgi:hypothetical protein
VPAVPTAVKVNAVEPALLVASPVKAGSLAAARVPLEMLLALVVSVVADAASPDTALEAIVDAVVSRPDVVVTTIWPAVEPIFPSFVTLPWTWLDDAAPISPLACAQFES